jgi:cell division protein FtsN
MTGVFLSFITWLATLPEPGAPEDNAGTPQEPADIPKPQFDFYTVLPAQKIEPEEAVVEPAADLGKPARAGATEQYMLQAGSFRQRKDAMARRAELLLLGLEPSVKEAQGDSGPVFRVFLGPFHSADSMARARGLTAGENIETLVLKRD